MKALAHRARCPLLALSIAALTSVSCPAQDQAPEVSPFELVPAGTHIVVAIDGPAALAKGFAGTRVGKLFASDAFANLVRKHWGPLEPKLQKKLQEHSLDLDDLRAQLLDYSGKIVLALHLGDDTLDFSKPPPEATITVLFGPDGKTPLKEICEKIVDAIREKQGDRIEELEFEGRTFLQLPAEGREGARGQRGRRRGGEGDGDRPQGRTLLPFMHRQHLCLCLLANDPKVALRRILNPERKPSYRPRAHLAGKIVFADLDLRGLLELVRRSLQHLDEDQDGESTKLFDDLGGACLERLEFMAEAKRPYVVQETRLQLNDKRLGLLAAVLPDQAGPSPLGNMLPGDIHTAWTFFLSAPRLYAAAKSALEDHPDVPFRFSSLEDGFETMFELRLKEDVLDHVGGHVLLMEHTTSGDDESEELDDFNPVMEMLRELRTYCVAVSLRDSEAFGKSLEKMLRKRGLHAARKTRDFLGFKVSMINLAGLRLHYTVTSRALLVAIGDDGGLKAMHSALDCENRVAKGEEPLPLRKEIADRVATEPDSHYGVGYDDLAGILGSVRKEYEAMQKTMEEYYEGGLEEAMKEDASLRVMVPLMRMLIDFSDLLRPFGLGTTAAVLRYQGREIVQRSVW